MELLLRGLDSLRGGLAHRTRGQGPLAGLLLGPALLILGVFGLFPLFYSVYLSVFQDGTGEFIGLRHYREALGGQPFRESFAVTLYYALGAVPATLVFSFLIASGLFRIARFRGTLRTLYFLPYVSSVVAAALIWRVMMEPREGVANLLIGLFGLPAQTWLLEPRGLLHILSDGHIPAEVGPSLALCSVILFEIWRSSGFMVVLFLAGLSAIPRELDDAAHIDGAGAIQLARHVTLPMLSPTIFFLSIIGVIHSFQAFSNIYALTGTGHGPLDTTQNLTVYIYANFYEYGRIGYGAAVATLLALTVMGLTLVQWRLIGRRVHYE